MSEEIDKARGKGRHKESTDARASASLYCLSTILCNKELAQRGISKKLKGRRGQLKRGKRAEGDRPKYSEMY